MNESFRSLVNVVFISAFGLIFLTAFTSLKPFRAHKKRIFSTILLKSTYLFYLSFYMVFLYILMFVDHIKINQDGIGENWVKFYMFMFLLVTIFPNIGIMVRRKFKTYRKEFNVVFSGINVLSVILIIVLLTHKKIGVF
ncbi:MAG: hypothetical protein HC896_04495 [Bacteroidales bacterium]|nr:hypothetical protein [Bacteroidales bacterium]